MAATLERVVIVGASLAGASAGQALRRYGYRGKLTIVGDERHAPYDRPLLSKSWLTSATEPDPWVAIDEQAPWDWHLGQRAEALDLGERRVVLGDGNELTFDGLILATGAACRTLPGTAHLRGVHTLRTLDDARALREHLRERPRVAVIGAGFIGGEVAASCRELGLDVALIDAQSLPHEHAIGPRMAQACIDLHRANGVELLLGAGVRRLLGDHAVEGVELTDGRRVDAELVVVGIGVTPATGWLDGSGLLVDDGVVCDERLRALDVSGQPVDGVVAAGDVCRWTHPGYGCLVRVEHWDTAVEQGIAAAATLRCGADAEPYSAVPYFWSDQYGIKVQFVGRHQTGDDVEVVDGAPEDGRFVAEYRREGKLVAALGFRRASRVMRYRREIAASFASHHINPPARELI